MQGSPSSAIPWPVTATRVRSAEYARNMACNRQFRSKALHRTVDDLRKLYLRETSKLFPNHKEVSFLRYRTLSAQRDAADASLHARNCYKVWLERVEDEREGRVLNERIS